jgi:DNA-binding transcriptional LysR family regulator
VNRIGDRGELEIFVRSVERGGFSAAARDLNLTPSALSRVVSRLEGVLGVRLLNRTTRKLTTTAEGALFLARCRRILAEYEDAEIEVKRSRERPRGKLLVHAGVGFATNRLVPAMPRFVACYPEVQVDLMVEDRDIDVVRNGIDISVRSGLPWNPSLVARKLGEFERVVCASPEYLARRGVPCSPDELAAHVCITVSSLPGRTQWPFQGTSGKQVCEVTPHLSATSADAVRAFARLGLGIARMNDFIVDDDIRAGRLVPILVDHYYPERVPMYALYPQDRHRLPKVAVMLDFLAENFDRVSWRSAVGDPSRPGLKNTISSRRKTARSSG